MHPLRISLVFAAQLLSLAFAIYSIRTSGVRVQVLLYAFVVDYTLRLWSVAMLHAEIRSADSSWISSIARFISRPPRARETSEPVREGEGGPPARLGTYFFVMAFLGFLAFILANVGADREVHIDSFDAIDDVSWAVAIGALYWVNSLLSRTVVIDAKLTLAQNLGYNTREVTVLALSVLSAGLVVAYRQSAGLSPSAWTVMGPLLGWRFIHELWASLDSLPAAPEAP